MTNNWTDIGNATLVVSMGANPSENHPACMAHINRAKQAPGYTRPSGTGTTVTVNKPAAELIVIDPRKTRTALQADKYIRIRPGTDIAFLNGVVNYLTNAAGAATGFGSGTYATQYARFRKFHGNLKTGRKFCTDATTGANGVITLADAWPQYSDAAFKLNVGTATASDYKRVNKTLSGKSPLDAVNANYAFANMPEWDTASITVDSVTSTIADISAAGSVYMKLKSHVAPYTMERTAEICGCDASDIAYLGDKLIEHSRFQLDSLVADSDGVMPDRAWSRNHRATTFLYAMGMTQHTCGGQNVKGLAVLQTLMGNMGWAGGGINALRGIHNVQGSTDMGLLYGNIPAYSGNPGKGSSFGSYVNGLFGNKLGTDVAATLPVGAADAGVTFTAKFAGKAGNYVTVEYVKNATAGVALSATSTGRKVGNDTYTDIKFVLEVDAGAVILTTAQQIVDFVNGNNNVASIMLKAANIGAGTGVVSVFAQTALGGGSSAYSSTDVNGVYKFSDNGLQQKGYYSMLKSWFGITSFRGTNTILGYLPNSTETDVVGGAVAEKMENKPVVDGMYALWPKGNGDNHVKMFRKMALADGDPKRVIASVVWGQNPAVTEPNQGKVRAGLKNLSLLVVTDIFETETAACDRRSDGFTYFIPACSHVEEAGSVTNSSRVLQWRYQAATPQGNTKTDLELLLRLAYALDGKSAFAHIKTAWEDVAGINKPGWVDAVDTTHPTYKTLYGNPGQYGWTPGSAFSSEAVAKKVHQQMTAPLNTGGTIWIYLDAWNDGSSNIAGRGFAMTGAAPSQADTAVPASLFGVTTEGIRAKARSQADNGNLLYANWGYAWLVNRRVLYQDGNVAGDQADTFQSPELVSRLFVSTYSGVVDYGQSYRTVHRLADSPRGADGKVPSFHVLPGRFPAHTEPYESPNTTWAEVTYGKNATTDTFIASDKDGADGTYTPTYQNLIESGTTVGNVGTYPLVLTTIRCVEHFQGGPITRNNWWNVEAEPEPWIELNSVDAFYPDGSPIKDGQYVKIITARTDGFTNDRIDGASDFPRALYGAGFKARVGVGAQTNQRVGAGVVAIPWHWGDRGLSTGSRANDLTIDAMDANTTIPEYKACLCRLERM